MSTAEVSSGTERFREFARAASSFPAPLRIISTAERAASAEFVNPAIACTRSTRLSRSPVSRARMSVCSSSNEVATLPSA